MIDKAFSLQGGLKKIIRKIEHDSLLREEGYVVLHGNAPEEARAFGRALEQAVGIPPSGYEEISPVLGLHLGAGTVGVTYFKK